MTRVAFEARGLVVVDDALAHNAFVALSAEVEAADYHSVHARRWDKSWRPWDGAPLRGEPVYFDPSGCFGWRGATYPTSSSVDLFVDRVRAVAAAYPRIAGVEGVDWVGLFLTPWLYPVGSALSWHCDAGEYTGAFTYFAHRRWQPHWGGALLAEPGWATPFVNGPPDDVTGDGSRPGEASWISDDGMNSDDELGVVACIFPRPNRLVLISPDQPHMITRVDVNAGAHVRATIAGFFLRPPAGRR